MFLDIKTRNKHEGGAGFSLIEITIVVAIFTVIVFGVAMLFSDILTNSSYELASLENTDQARMVLGLFTNEIRNALTGSDGSYPLNQAGNSQIIFFSDYKTPEEKIARIRYFISNNTLYKGVVLPTGSPASYNLGSETTRAVISGLANGSSPVFYYYNGDYGGATEPLSQPVNINQVKYIEMSLSVLNNIKPGDNSAFLVSAGATIRAVKDNLGN